MERWSGGASGAVERWRGGEVRGGEVGQDYCLVITHRGPVPPRRATQHFISDLSVITSPPTIMFGRKDNLVCEIFSDIIFFTVLTFMGTEVTVVQHDDNTDGIAICV